MIKENTIQDCNKMSDRWYRLHNYRTSKEQAVSMSNECVYDGTVWLQLSPEEQGGILLGGGKKRMPPALC